VGEACGRLRNVFTGQIYDPAGGSLPVANLLSDFPVAVLCDAEA
jgi:maltooligosyltrehalose synthase